jgi:Fe-S-cluster containining protein
MDEAFRQLVLDAAGREDVRAAVGRVYADLQGEVDRRRPVCVASGRCCRFEEFGHRLFVTTMELAAFVHGLPEADPRGASRSPASPWDGTGCPFQVRKLCGVHAIRPFGCRMFFCDATSTDWQNQAYEHFHARLKALHEELSVPYRYVEWRAALEMLGITPAHPGAIRQTPTPGQA